MSNRKFIRVFIIVFFASMLFIAAGNYIIDPYGFHFNNRYEGFNKHKPSFLSYTRLIKLYNADAIDPDAVFLGNSRILYLMPEEAFGEFKPATYYNFSFSSGTVNEMNDLLAYSIRNYNIKDVYYGIDFITMLSWNEKYASTFDSVLVAGDKSMLIEFLKLHTSTQAVVESYKCVTTNMADPEGRVVKYHYNKWGSRTNKWREMTYTQLGDAWLNGEFKKALDTYKPIYNSNIYLPEYKKQAYISILEQCRNNNIDYTAFINPLYKDHFQLLIKSSAYPLYLDFLRFLASNGGIWYFGGVNEITSDPDYFWDAQHPRNTMGSFISNPMFADNKPSYANNLFGTFYDLNNVEILISALDSLRMELTSAE